MKLLVHKSVYCINTNTDTENTVKQCATCQDYQNTYPQEKTIPHELPAKPWEIVDADIFFINNENCYAL